MSYPGNPSEDPYGQGPQSGQEGSGGQPGYQQGGYPPPHGQPGQPGQQPGGYPPPHDQSGYQQGGYPPPHGQPGQQPGGYPPPHGYHDQTGGYQAAGYQQGGYGHPGAYGPSSATTGQPNPDERQMGLFAHLGGGLLGWIVPLIIYLIKKDESPFVRDQAAQALNFQLLIMIGYLISWVLVFVFIGALTWFALIAVSIIFGILGGMAAHRGELYRYPFNVSWIS